MIDLQTRLSLYRCLVLTKLQKCANEPKLHQGKTCIKPQKRVKKQSTAGGSSVAKFRNLRNLQVANFRNLRNLQVANFRNPAKFQLSSPSLQHFCSKFPLVRSCIFEFGSGSSCLNRIEDNEPFDLQNYKK